MSREPVNGELSAENAEKLKQIELRPISNGSKK